MDSAEKLPKNNPTIAGFSFEHFGRNSFSSKIKKLDFLPKLVFKIFQNLFSNGQKLVLPHFLRKSILFQSKK